MTLFSAKRNGVVQQTFALVLAGGRGERLHSLTEQQAKPALHFGAGYRVIDFPLSNCVNSGLRRIGVATQYRAHELIQHVQRAWSFLRPEMNEFVELWPAQQQTAAGDWYAGTADAVYQNIDLIQRHRPQYVLILAGDHIYKQDYGAMIAEHVQRGAEVTVSCIEVRREEGRRFGVMEVNAADEIVNFREKPERPLGLPDAPSRCLASMGIYLFNTKVLLAALRQDARTTESRRDFGRDIIPRLLGNCRLFAHRFARSCVTSGAFSEPYWRDVGTVDAYWQANMDLIQHHPPFDLYDRSWAIWTHQTQAPAARFTYDEQGRSGVVINSIFAPGVVVCGGTVRKSVLFSNVRVDTSSVVDESLLLPGVQIAPGARLRRCIVAEGTRVPENLVIGEGADTDQHFDCTPEGVTTVTQRMINKLRAPTKIRPEREKIAAATVPVREPIRVTM